MTNIVAYREVGYKSSPANINKILILFYKGRGGGGGIVSKLFIMLNSTEHKIYHIHI